MKLPEFNRPAARYAASQLSTWLYLAGSLMCAWYAVASALPVAILCAVATVVITGRIVQLDYQHDIRRREIAAGDAARLDMHRQVTDAADAARLRLDESIRQYNERMAETGRPTFTG